MTDDQLTALLASAADLRPSPALRARVADLRPRRLPLLALSLSGAAGVAAIAAFALLPRVSSAEALLRDASQKQSRISGRFRSEEYRDGVWRPNATGIFAPGWSRSDDVFGNTDITTPGSHIRRSGKGAPFLLLPKDEAREEVPTLGGLLRFFRKMGCNPEITEGSPREEEGRGVREVTITLVGRRERERVTLDRETELPIRILSESFVRSGWTSTRRVSLTYPGPTAGSPEFWRGVDRSRIVNTAGLAREWERRLSPVLRTLTLASGKTMVLRDVRATAAGDVFVLYTGAANVRARLTGAGGTRYLRVAWEPNNGRTAPRSRPPLILGGEPLRGLWFIPATGSAPPRGPVRLEILGAGLAGPLNQGNPDPEATGSFMLDPTHDPALVPAWATALDSQGPALDPEGDREGARLVAASDGWIDANGKPVEGTYRLRPELGDWASEPPRSGLRRDPAAARAAIVALRAMIQRAESMGKEINPLLVESYVGRFEREARGVQP